MKDPPSPEFRVSRAPRSTALHRGISQLRSFSAVCPTCRLVSDEKTSMEIDLTGLVILICVEETLHKLNIQTKAHSLLYFGSYASINWNYLGAELDVFFFKSKRIYFYSKTKSIEKKMF